MKNKLYESGDGDTLVDDSLYPTEVKKYLFMERLEISKKLESYNTLVEVGCMITRHLDQAIENNKNYIGVDIVQRYINEANLKNSKIEGWGSKYSAICYNALMLEEAFEVIPSLKQLDKTKTLFLFPFNSFGNIDDCNKMLEVLNRLEVDFMINSYKTDTKTNEFRINYYKKNAMTNLELIENGDGVTVWSDEKLNSKCFKEKYYTDRCNKISFNNFGDFGKSINGYAQ
jgi:hypothetical protein